MKVKEKIPAKINLTLDIVGTEGKFHNLNSLVSSINIFDVITLSKRKDKRVTLKTKGIDIDCADFDNNAYKAALAFMQKFDTKGVDITINKKIPLAGGLGGSSADAAGVLRGMKKLYKIECELSPLANELGSDTTYMLNGGYAVMSGRGIRVEQKDIPITLYTLLITSNKAISARECYKKYDQLNKVTPPCTSESVKKLIKGDIEGFCKLAKNDLEEPANNIVDIHFPKMSLIQAGALVAQATGSGPTVYGIFKDKKQRDIAYKKLLPLFKDKIIKANTIVKK